MSGLSFRSQLCEERPPVVTLSSIGIAFNSAARAALGNPERILIGYDESEHALALML